MCHNHSHIMAHLLGEDTALSLPVLTFQLANDTLKVETPHRGSGSLSLKTSGLLRVPSMMLAAYYPRLLPAMEGECMSLFCLPEGATTTILKATWAWMNALETLPAESVDLGPHPIALVRSSDDDDVPW